MVWPKLKKAPRDHFWEDGQEDFRCASERVNEPNDGLDEAPTGISSEKHWMSIFSENSNQPDKDLGGEKIVVSPRSSIQIELRGWSGGGRSVM